MLHLGISREVSKPLIYLLVISEDTINSFFTDKIIVMSPPLCVSLIMFRNVLLVFALLSRLESDNK